MHVFANIVSEVTSKVKQSDIGGKQQYAKLIPTVQYMIPPYGRGKQDSNLTL